MKKLILSCLIFLSSCAPASKSPSVSSEEALTEVRYQQQIAAQERMKQLERLYRIGSPILAANAPLCGKKVWPYHGMMLESLKSVPDIYKDAMQVFYGVENQLTAAYVVKDSPAFGKIFTGDRIIKANGISIPSGSKGLRHFYDAIWEEGRDVTLPITLTVERGRNRKQEDVVIHPTSACASMLIYERDDEVNAYADSFKITFTTGMMRVAQSDDMFAGVLAHELAHNARLHIEAGQVNQLIGEIAGLIIEAGTGVQLSDILSDLGSEAFSQDFETEADYVGLYMLARTGGYNLDNAIEMQRLFAAEYPESIHLAGTTHPSTAKRFISLKKTAAEIREKQAKGLPLVPDEQPPIF